MSEYRWGRIDVNNPEFVQSGPTAGVPLGPTSMLVFGGNSTKCFKVDRVSESRLLVQATKSQLMQEGPIYTHYTSIIGANYFAIN